MAKKKTAQPHLAHPLDVAIGARMRAVRLLQDPVVTQQWLGREIGVSIQQVQKYESGQNAMSFSRVCEAARALDMEVTDFIAPVVARWR